ncbi:hypothetical protein HEP87_59935 [Streptomyces sp. S1D4-11]
MSLTGTDGEKNFSQFRLTWFSAAARSSGPVGLGGALLGRSTVGVGGGVELPPPLLSPHAVRAPARTSTTSAATPGRCPA